MAPIEVPPSGAWLSPQAFSQAVAALPLVSLDAYVLDANGRLLLGQRNNAPARGAWFTPGGRVRKGETLPLAWKRLWAQELGWHDRPVPAGRLLGGWDHMYPDSAFDPNMPTHYVNLAYAVEPPAQGWPVWDLPQGEKAQHGQWQWLALDRAAIDDAVHVHVRTTLCEGWRGGLVAPACI